MNWLILYFGFCAGLAIEKWAVRFGWPDKTAAGAWLFTVLTVVLGIWLTIVSQREEERT